MPVVALQGEVLAACVTQQRQHNHPERVQKTVRNHEHDAVVWLTRVYLSRFTI
jgi:hypothetical protein